MTESYKIKNTLWKGILAYLILLFGLLAIDFIIIFSYWHFAKTLSINLFFWIFAITIIGFFVIFFWSVSVIKITAEPEQKFVGKQKTVKGILSLNSAKHPFEIIEDKNYDLILQFRLADAAWKGKLFNKGIKKAYWLYLTFDENKKTSYCVEKTKTIEWDTRLGLNKITAKFKRGFFYGIILFEKKKIVGYSWITATKKMDIDYDITEIKWPIFNLLLKNGWAIKPKILPIQIRKPKE